MQRLTMAQKPKTLQKAWQGMTCIDMDYSIVAQLVAWQVAGSFSILGSVTIVSSPCAVRTRAAWKLHIRNQK